MDKSLNKSNPILKNFLKRIKIKKDCLLILINFKAKFTLPLISPIIKNIQSILLKIYNKPFLYINILHISRNTPPRLNKTIRYL